MKDCKNLIHPFQHDPGLSQRQRVLDDLLSGAAKIDGRSLADLLDYFKQLSQHVNFYETDLSVSNWQPFFQKSLPFTIAGITKFDGDSIEEKLVFYHQLFRRHPSSSGLQLLVHSIYYRLINSLNNWQLQLHGSELPVAFALEKLIKDKLQATLKEFVKLANAAVKWYCIKPVDWQRLHHNEVWDLYFADLQESDQSFKEKGNTQRERKLALYEDIRNLSPAFLDVMRVTADAAAASMDQSLLPLKKELQERHPPHLALMFAFLKLFRHLQSDLNSFTKKHLDFFYKQVLQLKSRDAAPDKAHIVFEIQNQLDGYLLREGLQVKDGKDDNKAEVFFALDDEIVVNKTQVADTRTLFLNNQTVYDKTFVEGVYAAPDAGKADGIDKDFKQNGVHSFPTLGAKYSKYADPEHSFIKPYPNARLAFILASPVLLLNEGKRTITINLGCRLKPDICEEITLSAGAPSSCCEENEAEESETFPGYPSFASSSEFYDQIAQSVNQTYYYISQELIARAQQKGISAHLTNELKNFLTREKKVCYCENDVVRYDAIVPATNAEGSGFEDVFTAEEVAVLADLFGPRKALNALFSGEEEWLSPSVPPDITLTPPPLPGSGEFMLTITATLEADKPAVTFYDKESLREDFNTTLPLVKIELDDKIKIKLETVADPDPETEKCCLEKQPPEEGLDVSLYHFFRNVVIVDSIGSGPDDETRIEVTVCELKNFVVQNDESVQDVNSPVYPFGTRPKIDANFYLGSEEVFLKKWNDIFVNINWKDLPVPPAPTDPLHDKPFQHYYNGYQDFLIKSGVETNVIEDKKFRMQLSVLQDGVWEHWKYTEDCSGSGDPKCQLFQTMPGTSLCDTNQNYTHQFHVSRQTDYVPELPFSREELQFQNISRFDVNTRQSFIRITLKCQDFQHDKYPFVLARQMSALGKLPEIVDGAVYYGVILGGPPPQFITLNMPQILQEIIDNYNLSLNPDLLLNLEDLIEEIDNRANPPQNINNAIWTKLFIADDPSTFPPGDPPLITDAPLVNPKAHSDYYSTLKTILDWLKDLKEEIEKFKDKGVVIPNEPWTPIISKLSIDYTATATATDIDLIHLYPYKGTYKPEELESEPTLLPTFCDEGTLFLGLEGLVPGSNVNMLFQLAEATADSESERAELHWFYLDNNQWKLLRDGFEVLEDATDGLTATGIIKFALPANMTSDNTILPKGLHWIKAAIPQNSRSVSETIGIHTQAIRVTFTNEEANDKMRLADALPAGSIAKLKEADASVKKINQPYDGFGGRLPEAAGHFYVRVSELLRHKGRSVQKFDYEHLALEAFPTLFKVKCINHSFGLDAHRYFNDFPVSPGYVLLAVIPDLNQLKAAASFEPRAPVSLLASVKDYLDRRTSPFVRLKIMNPRYEKVHFCLKIKLHPGRDESFYKAKLISDLREFLAPWAIGQYDKLAFGQCIYRSDIVRFLETRDYLDYLLDLRMVHEQKGLIPVDQPKVCPVTPRSILIAGDVDVCIPRKDCEDWEDCEDESGREIDCCDHEKIALADYCEEPVIK